MKKHFNLMKYIIPFVIIILLSGNQLLAQPFVKIVSPSEGAELVSNNRYSISWESNSVDKVDLYYSINGTEWITITKNIISEIGSFSWKVPNINTNSLKLKAISSNNAQINDISDDLVSIITNEFQLGKSNFELNSQNVIPIKIMPLGNSITFDNRANDTRVVEDKIGYRYHLFNMLKEAGYSFDFIGSEHAGNNFFLPDTGFDDNAGFPGIRDNQLAYLLQTGRLVMNQFGINEAITTGPYLNTFSPDVVLLHIGTNANEQPDGTSPVDVENILDEIEWFENTSGKEVTVFLARIIDRVPNESYVTTFNDSVESMVMDRVLNPGNDAYPDNIIMVDMQDSANIDYTIDEFGTIGNGLPGDMSDFLHPNDKGYFKLAQVWYKALIEHLNTPITIQSHPSSVSSIVNGSVSFDVEVLGGTPINYQWKKNGIDIVGATDSIYVIESVQIEDNNAEFSCKISNNVSVVESNKANLYVYDENTRVTGDQLVLYKFEEGSGSNVYDSSNYLDPLDLEIHPTSRIRWIPYGIELEDKSVISTNSINQKIHSECLESNEITVEAWLKPNNILQGGPARIVTFSNDGLNRNFTLGQNGDKLSFRLRTVDNTDNGLPGLESTPESVGDSLMHIAFVRDSIGEAKFFINGILNSLDTISGDFSNWDASYNFGLGDEFNSEDTDRFWLGKLYLTSLYSRALTDQEVQHNYSVGFNGMDRLLFVPTNLNGTIQNDTNVILTWEDNELSESGYIIERRANLNDSTYFILDTVLANTLEYIDNNPKYHYSYLYRVKAFNNNSESDYSIPIMLDGIMTDVENLSSNTEFSLYQNYPNPFNPSTLIKYSIPSISYVNLDVFNILGQKVRGLFSKRQNKGEYTYNFTADNMSAGVYFLILNSESIDSEDVYNSSIKMILLK